MSLNITYTDESGNKGLKKIAGKIPQSFRKIGKWLKVENNTLSLDDVADSKLNLVDELNLKINNIPNCEFTYSSGVHSLNFDYNNYNFIGVAILTSTNQVLATGTILVPYFKAIQRMWLDGNVFVAKGNSTNDIYVSSSSTTTVTKVVVWAYY